MLGYYNFGPGAAKISGCRRPTVAHSRCDYGQKVFPGISRELRDQLLGRLAPREVQSRRLGACGARARAATYPVLCEPDGRIYLAGEHLSYLIGGWQAGAFESAWQQIERLHARAMKG
jgi:monoamine oxidase